MIKCIVLIPYLFTSPIFSNKNQNETALFAESQEYKSIHDRFYEEIIQDTNENPQIKMTEHNFLENVNPYPYQTGWPKKLEQFIWNAVSFSDVDNSGYLKVLCASVVSGYAHIKNYDGTNFPNWPVFFSEYNYGELVAGDVDNDGKMEVFLGANTHSGNAVLYGWKYDGTSLPGWPIHFANKTEVNSSAVLSDLDTDGDIEIIFSLYKGDSTYVFNHDGTIFPGWPQRNGTEVRDAPVVGDLDGDGDLEIICASKYRIYAWHHNGTSYTHFPIAVSRRHYIDGVAMGDLDNDDDQEIIVNTVGAEGNIIVYHHDGTLASGWPQSTGASLYAEACLADLDNDSDLEIIIGGTGMFVDYHVWAWHHNGRLVSGWPAVTEMGEWCQSSSAIGDIDNDGDMEVIIGSDNHKVYAFHHDATLVDGWPITGPTHQVSAPISLGDIDRDGDIEIGVGSLDSMIHIWDLDGILESANIEWETYHHDPWFTGWYHPVPPKNLNGELIENTIVLAWSPNSEPDIVGYNIYRSTNSGYPYTKLNSTLHPDTTFVDTDITVADAYYYVVTARIKPGSESRYSNEIQIPTTTRVDQHTITDDLKDFTLFQNYPNPFNAETIINYRLPVNAHVRLVIYNLAGQKVKTLIDGWQHAGNKAVSWNANAFPSGIYLFQLQSANYVETRKMILLR